jgi:hypothetical protein
MSGVAHSVPESNDLPDKLEDVEPPVGLCALCGDDQHAIAIRPCFTEARGWWTGARCVDVQACRVREANLKETPDAH